MVHSKVNLNEIYSLLYITRLDDTRFRPDEKRTLKLLTEKLGSNIWNNAILVLTFAASVDALYIINFLSLLRYSNIRSVDTLTNIYIFDIGFSHSKIVCFN